MEDNNNNNSSNLLILFCGFQRGVSHIWGSSLKNGLDHTKYSTYCLTIQYCW
jgi:hypothetical protein